MKGVREGLNTMEQPSTEAMESQELHSYKMKVDQMTVLLKHYRTELEAQKIRRDGMETVSRLLTEARQENIHLKRNQAALETMVQNLQNRLMVNGLPSSSATEDKDILVPGTSKQTLTNLAMENKRLRSMLQKDGSSDIVGNSISESLRKPSIAEDTETELQQTIEKLEAENKSMRMKLSDLEDLFKSSNNEKDQQIVEFRAQIQQLQQTAGSTSPGATTPGTPEKRSADAQGLKEMLRSFMSQCQNFEAQLETVSQVDESSFAHQDKSIELQPVKKQAAEGGDSVDSVDATHAQLLEEKQTLQARLEEVTNMNQRWQEFSNGRAKYTQSLEQKLQELQERLKESMRGDSTQEIQRRIEQVLEKSQKDVGIVEEKRRQAEEEVARLKQEIAARDGNILQLQNQVTILSRTSHHNGNAEAHSTIEHLRAQIQVCTEDFEKERQDRQVALQKVASLQEQVNRFQKLNAHLQLLVSNQGVPAGQTHRPAAQEHSQCPSHTDPHALQPRGSRYNMSNIDFDGPRIPQPRSEGWRDFPDFDYEAPCREPHKFTHLEPVSMPVPDLVARGGPRMSRSDSALASDTNKQENFLTCPKCNKEFCEERQGELLAHMDDCWE